MAKHKTYRKQAIDEDRYAASLLMTRYFGNKNTRKLEDICPRHLTLMSSMAGNNLIFRASDDNTSFTVALSIKGIKFASKWSNLTNIANKMQEGFNSYTGERYHYTHEYNSAWARGEPSFNSRVDALLYTTTGVIRTHD